MWQKGGFEPTHSDHTGPLEGPRGPGRPWRPPCGANRASSRFAVARRTMGILRDPVGILRDPVGILRDPVGILRDPVGLLKDRVGILRDPVGTLRDPVVASLRRR